MPNIKTAISIERPIFDQVNDLAKNLNISRSRLFVIAAQKFIQRHTNMELLQSSIPVLPGWVLERMSV